jgi:hypothetical protein
MAKNEDLVIPTLRDSSREDLAWAAGLFEGEGSFTVMRRGTAYMSIVAELGMTDEDRVREFHRIVGVGNVTTHISRDITRSHYKPIHVWKVGSFEGVQAVIGLLWFRLGTRRRGKAIEILVAYKSKTSARRRFALARAEEIDKARSLLSGGMSKRKVAIEMGRSYGFVNHIKRGRTHVKDCDAQI